MFGHGMFRAARLAFQRQPISRVFGQELPSHGISAELQAVARHMTLATTHAGLGMKAVLNGAPRMATALLLGGSGAAAFLVNQDEESQETQLDNLHWVNEISRTPGIQEEHSPSVALRKHPVLGNFTDDDHLFGVMLESGQIQELKCFYHPDTRKFYSIVQLGKDVCGYPQTVHGGLTAAIVDETFGGLSSCLWKSGALGVQMPAFTARLEVDYKKKIPAGQTLLVCTEVENIDGRKLWMRATVSDGTGATFASGRALFVAPKITPGFTPRTAATESTPVQPAAAAAAAAR